MASSDLFDVRLSSVEYGAPGINIYRFSSIDGSPLPAFEPGAHIDIELTEDVTRQYSLIWPAPSASDYLIAVQVAETGKGGSRRLHYESVVGATYKVSLPRNHFQLQDSEYCYLLAGGIGITPIVSMYRLRKEQGLPVKMIYWTTTREQQMFASELRADAAQVQLLQTRENGGSPRLKDMLADIPLDAAIYCCGPSGMIDEFEQATANRQPELIHRERFSASTDALQPNDGFQVLLQRSGLTLTVGPEETLLQVCEAAGVEVTYSCEEGVCGACEVKVLAGEIEHRDTVLSAQQRAAGNCMMACCSRGVGHSLVVDL
jgi:ferredoxin-NADP reductase